MKAYVVYIVFRPLDIFNILLLNNLILKLIISFFFPLINLHAIPDNDKAKTVF